MRSRTRSDRRAFILESISIDGATDKTRLVIQQIEPILDVPDVTTTLEFIFSSKTVQNWPLMGRPYTTAISTDKHVSEGKFWVELGRLCRGHFDKEFIAATHLLDYRLLLRASMLGAYQTWLNTLYFEVFTKNFEVATYSEVQNFIYTHYLNLQPEKTIQKLESYRPLLPNPPWLDLIQEKLLVNESNLYARLYTIAGDWTGDLKNKKRKGIQRGVLSAY